MPDVTPDTNADAGAILEGIRESIHRDEHRYTVHAQTQMAARHITSAEIVETLLSDAAEVIEEYPDDKYSPSCLVYGVAGSGRSTAEDGTEPKSEEEAFMINLIKEYEREHKGQA